MVTMIIIIIIIVIMIKIITMLIMTTWVNCKTIRTHRIMIEINVLQ